MRQRRLLLGMSQAALGNAAAIAYQQVQKYEAGRDRISSSRLFEFAKILNVPVPYFFEEMAPGLAKGRRKLGRPKQRE
jgi:transcriptional regulator with XRE-family HTH domain